MKRVFLLIAFLFISPVPSVAAADILIVQSLQVKPYNDALRGFRSVCTGDEAGKLISSELSEAEVVRRVRRGAPDLIFAIGLDALEKVRTIRDVPIVYAMVLNPEPVVANLGNVAGVSLNIQPERQLAALRKVLPHLRRVGLLYDPGKSAPFVRRAEEAARPAGIELLARKVRSSRDAVTALDGLKGKIDALWLIPDTTVADPKTTDLLFLSAIENRIPVFAFSGKYLGKGALLSLEVDATEEGRQAGEMANRVLDGAGIRGIGRTDARGGIMTINLIVAKKLGIAVPHEVLRQAQVVK